PPSDGCRPARRLVVSWNRDMAIWDSRLGRPPQEHLSMLATHEGLIRDNVESVRHRIASAAQRAGRDPAEITLVAVTKKCPLEWIRPLVAAGATDLGENYPQELWKKAEFLHKARVHWHLIGHLQGNKVKKTIPLVRWVHTVDSLKLLQTLDDLAASLADPPKVCLQVNMSGAAAKHGWSEEEILRDAE